MSLTVAVRSIVNVTLGSSGTSATVSPGELTLVLSQPTPAVSTGITAAVGDLTLTFSIPASTVSTGASVTITPSDLGLTLSQPTATIKTSAVLSSVADNRANYASSQIPKGSTLEVNFQATTVATRPKWPYDASAPSGIDGTVGANAEIQISYDGFSSWVSKPAYYEQTFTHLVHSDSPSQIATGQDWLYPTTTYQWTAKYQVTTAGTLQYRLSFQDANGTTLTAASTSITTITSAARGIIRQAASDARYFERSLDGSFYWPVGGNASEIGDNPSNVTDIDMDDGQSGNSTSMAAWASTGGINFMRWFANTLGVQSNAGSPWVDGNNRTRLAMLSRDGVTADSGSVSDAAWRLDNRSYAITTTGTLTSGSFTITIDGQTTAAIPYTAAGDTVYGALKLLSNVGDPNMFVDLAGGPTMATAGTVVRFFPSPDCALPASVSINSSVGGGSIALTSTAAGIGSTYIRDGWLKRSAAVKPSTVYKFTVRYRIPSTLVPIAGNGGLSVKLDTNWVNDPPAAGVSGTGKYLTDATSGSGGNSQWATTNTGSGWATLTGYYATTSTQRWLPYVYVVLDNCSTSSGGQVAYVDYVKVEETNGSGVVNGPQVNNRWDADFHQEFDEFYAKTLDLILAEADTNNIALKLVMDGADALVGSFTNANGVGIASNSNFYGPSDQTITRGRWWLRAWWRYLHARWGQFSSVHTFELMNEGDPFDGGHANLAQMFGTFLGQKSHQWANSHLTTTSFFHSWPRALFTDAKVADATLGIDYADIHLYVRDPAQFTGTQTYNSSQNYASSPATSINIYIDDTTVGSYTTCDWRDPPLNVDRLGNQIGANAVQGLGVPVMRGENGLYDSSTDSPATTLASDTGLIWLRKHLWGQLHPSGFMDPSWWYWRSEIYDRSDGSPNNLAKFKPWSDFVQSLALNTGGFVDAAATAPHAEIRATGLKHTTSGRCYLWIDHLVNRWTDVVAGTTVTSHSGNVTVGSMPNGTYDVIWIDPSDGSTISSTTGTASGGTLTLALPSALSTDIAVKATLQAGSGNITVTPSDLVVTFSQPASTVTTIRNATVTATDQVVTFSQPAATVSTAQNVTATPGELTLTLSQPASTVTAIQNVTVAASELVLTLSLPAPTTSAGQSVTVNAGLQTATLTIPVATTSAGSTISVGMVSLTSSVQTVSVVTTMSVTVNVTMVLMSFSLPTSLVNGTPTGGTSPKNDRGRLAIRILSKFGF